MCLSFSMLLFMEACEKDDNYVSGVSHCLVSEKTDNDTPIELGQELNDPYKLSNMQEALDQLTKEGVAFPYATLRPTGYYVRVLIHSMEEMDQIDSDSNLIWFDYPLNYEVSKEGSYYVDPSLEDSAWSWQYGVVPTGYSLPENLQVETIYPVFIPDECSEYKAYEESFDRLEDLSETLCGNDAKGGSEDSEAKATKWYPSARITVWDDLKNGYVPLEGVRVSARRCCKTRWAVTNASGYCRINTKFKKNVSYSIEWSRHYWRIVKSERNKKTYLTGPSLSHHWDMSIPKSQGEDYMRATIHRAALVANYKDMWTIARLEKKRWGITSKVIIRYNHSGNGGAVGSVQYGSNENLHGADVIIWGRDAHQSLWPTHDMFSATLHELAHCAHYYWYNSTHSDDNFHAPVAVQFKFVMESWATCVQWKVTTDYYDGMFGQTGYGGGKQSWTATTSNEYTPIFIDLMDDYNQGRHYGGSVPNDNVSGYTLKEIQDNILGLSTNFEGLQVALKAFKLHGTTDAQLDDLLYHYNNLSW